MDATPATTSALRLGKRTLSGDARPWLMGIVNVTPDSFSDGGLHLDPDAAIAHALQLVEAGADLLDLGAESTRPGSAEVAPEVQLRRLVPVLRALRPRVVVPISIDTTSAQVARVALDLGADVINDTSGVRADAEMPAVLAASDCGVVVMHMKGTPRTMQQSPAYADVVREVAAWMRKRLAVLAAAGIAAERIVLDPGIGFGKLLQHNLALLRDLDRLQALGRPLVVGASRKSFLGALLDEPAPRARLAGDLAVVAHARAAGVAILRVHDVRAARGFLRVLAALAAGEA
jgi:dihydropteroate synthase